MLSEEVLCEWRFREFHEDYYFKITTVNKKGSVLKTNICCR